MFFLERLYFSFQFSLVLFAAINGWTPTNFFWRRCTRFHLPRTPHFSLLSFNECSLFLLLRLAFIFHLNFCSYIVISLHQGVFLTSGPCWFSSKELFQKGLNGCWKREKVSCKKVVQKRACLDFGLDFCMP
jgi:hypothetical protein